MVIERVKRTIKDNNLINANEHIVIGLSGGPDSVCLFDVLMKLKDEMNLTIHPVHVNHKFRPQAAERDQSYVENLCRQYDLECHSFVIDCNKLASEQGMTSEEAGRKARYDAFYQVAAELTGMSSQAEQKAKPTIAPTSIKIAVAQNSNDQAETILFRLLRGTGVDGIAGIAYEREERGFKVIRPLLDVSRNVIEEYCRANNLNPVIDHTNNKAIYARNKIRLELIPYLEDNYNENIKESLVRLGRIAAADKEYLWQQTEKVYRDVVQDDRHELGQNMQKHSQQNRQIILERQGLAGLHKALRHRVIIKAFAEVGLTQDITEERLEAADFIIERKQGAKVVQFPHEYRLEVASGKVRIFRQGPRNL